MSNNFNVKINCIVFSTNIHLNKRFVLSIDKDSMVFPSFDVDSSSLENIEQNIVNFLKSFVFISDIELWPQLINIHSNLLSKQENELNIIYGSIINHTDSINNAYWTDFDILQEAISQIIEETNNLSKIDLHNFFFPKSIPGLDDKSIFEVPSYAHIASSAFSQRPAVISSRVARGYYKQLVEEYFL